MDQLKLQFRLIDADEQHEPPYPETEFEIEILPHCIWIRPKGYGTSDAADGEGWPIGIEVYRKRLRVIAFNDINNDEPTLIHMEGAREETRKEECE